MINRDRVVNSFIEMVKIYSPPKQELEFANYLIKRMKNLGMEIYLDENQSKYGGNCPTVFAKLKGNIVGEGVTLCAHLDVIEPCKSPNVLIENGIIKTDGTTTLGGDDKGGVASILEVIEALIENNCNYEDIYVVFTPGEEIGMAGAKAIDWSKVPSDMKPSKNMIVVDNAGRAGYIAHTAPCKYDFEIEFIGKSAHAGIEPEKGISSIVLASDFIKSIEIGRIDSLTTSNIGVIESKYPSNVVPNSCVISGELRGHDEDKVLNILNSYKELLENQKKNFGSNYKFDYFCNFPPLKPQDNLQFANEFKKVYEKLGVESELQVIGGGSDSNIFAKEGYNSIIVGVGMVNVHSVDETLDIEELLKTTKAIFNYIKK